jgi:hypothetical protein
LENVDYDLLMAHDLVITTYDTVSSACKNGQYFDHVRMYGEKGLNTGRVVGYKQRKKESLNPTTNKTGPQLIFEVPWTRMFLDESQCTANPTTCRFESVISVYAKHKWCLTGTIHRNYPVDVWSQLFFCGYSGVPHPNEWKKTWKLSFFKHNLQKRIMDITYASAGIQMPVLQEKEIQIQFTNNEDSIYGAILKLARETLVDVNLHKLQYSALLAMFVALRKSCICPFLAVTHNGQLSKTQQHERQHLTGINAWVTNVAGAAGLYCSKFDRVVDIVRNDTQSQDKILIFSSFATALELLSERLASEHITNGLVIGKMTHKHRENVLQSFRRGELKTLLLTYKVGSEGLNLTEANHCIFLEPWWNYATTDQAKKRAWRLGQEKPVTVHKLVFHHSIETLILLLCEDKRKVGNFFKTGKDPGPKCYKGLNKETLQEILAVGTRDPTLPALPRGSDPFLHRARAKHTAPKSPPQNSECSSKDSLEHYDYFKRHCKDPSIHLKELNFATCDKPSWKDIEKRFKELAGCVCATKTTTPDAKSTKTTTPKRSKTSRSLQKRATLLQHDDAIKKLTDAYTALKEIYMQSVD